VRKTSVSEKRNPVLIGLAQLVERDADPESGQGPIEMMLQIAREAATDCGAPGPALEAVDTVGVVGLAGTRAKNPPQLVARELGIRPRRELMTEVGGEMPLVMVNQLAEEIVSGASEMALILGANSLATMAAAHKGGHHLDWLEGGDGEPEMLGLTKPGIHERERRHGLILPTQIYPLIENALRARRGLSPEEHNRKLGRLMAPFTEVAAENPYSWFPTPRSAEELLTVSAENRMIAHPYPKYLNAVLATNQAAGLLLASEATADALGVPEAKRVHWWGGAQTVERSWFVSERDRIADAPAMRTCAERTFENAGITIDDISHLDFYSCFPVAVEMACEAFGVAEDDPRGLTTSGGLPYHGGPVNNYTLHSLVTVAERCRARPGDLGLVTGNGWYLTKHSANVWSTRPKPGAPPGGGGDQPLETGPEPLEVSEEASGPGRIEGYTLVYDREGRIEQGIVIGRLLAGGERFLANVEGGRDVLAALAEGEAVGREGVVRPEDGRNLFAPN
jgi:acetyl-CoA C-acetyltransferase